MDDLHGGIRYLAEVFHEKIKFEKGVLDGWCCSVDD
jgi:hypothetical protein